jgi:nucleolar complex protein 2
MANKSKQFKKFASSGKLKETIDKRRKNQQSRRKAEDRTTRRAKQRGAPLEFGEGEDGEGSDDDAKEVRSANAAVGGRAGGVAKNVEELFGQGGLDGVDNGEGSDLEDLSEEDEEDSEEDAGEDEGEDDMLDEEAMKKAMKDLEKKDPEFFKYLKENDEDLLEFGKGKSKAVAEEDDAEDSDVDMEDGDEEEEEEAEKKISVTLKMVRQWQEGTIKVSPLACANGVLADRQQHSLRSLRKTLLAFRTAAHMNEDDADQGTGLDTKYRIDSAQGMSSSLACHLSFCLSYYPA